MQNFLGSLSLLLFLSSAYLAGVTADFCYDDTNEPGCKTPNQWPGFCTNGSLQSPIAIPYILNASYVHRAVQLKLASYQASSFQMKNNGENVVIRLPPSNKTALLRLENLRPTEYILDSAHFHWGKQDASGSEHCLAEGRCFSMEMHLVHYRKDLGSVGNALASPDNDTLAVLGVFLDVDSTVSSGNPQLAPIVQNLPKVGKPVDWVNFPESIDLRPLINKRNGGVFTYRGSLTTPDCNEKVNWNVYDKVTLISYKDSAAFRLLQKESGQTIDQTHRPLQARNNRAVYRASVSTS